MMKKLLSKLGVKKSAASKKADVESSKQFKKLPKKLDQLDHGYKILVRELSKR